MVVGPGRTVGEHMINDPRLALVSFTGSSEVPARARAYCWTVNGGGESGLHALKCLFCAWLCWLATFSVVTPRRIRIF